MLKKIAASLFALALAITPALAGSSTIAVTPGSGATYQVITNGSSNFVGEFGLCDGVAAAQCVAVKAASTAAVATDPALVVAISPNNTVGVTGTFWQTTQPVSGTVAATQSGSWSLVNISGTVSLPTGAATGIADNAAWTAGTTPATAIGCEYTSGGATALSTGHVGTPGCTIARGLFTDLESVGGTALGAVVSNLGTLASGTPATLNVNNYMVGCASTVCNPNGANTAANSSPTTLPADQTLTTSAGSASLTAADAATTSATWANSQTALSGTPTTGSYASYALSPGVESVGVQVSGTFSATIETDLSMDGGTHWFAVPVFQDGIVGGHSSFTGTGVTANFAGYVNVGRATNFRVRATAYTSGTATVAVQSSLDHAMAAALPPLPANQSANLNQVGGSSLALGPTTASASVPAVLPSNQSVADPCMFQAKTKVPFSTTSGSTQLVALSGSTKIYVCAVHFISTAADSISFVEGTGTACATSATAVSGSTTAASGMDFAANSGMTEGGGGGTIMNTSVAGDEFCLLQSGTSKIAGNLEVVQQ